jgi:hypothetical protein
MTFPECVVYCAKQRGLVEQFDRLTGSHLSEVGKGAPLDRMIDDATGRYDEDMRKWTVFVWDLHLDATTTAGVEAMSQFNPVTSATYPDHTGGSCECGAPLSGGWHYVGCPRLVHFQPWPQHTIQLTPSLPCHDCAQTRLDVAEIKKQLDEIIELLRREPAA